MAPEQENDTIIPGAKLFKRVTVKTLDAYEAVFAMGNGRVKVHNGIALHENPIKVVNILPPAGMDCVGIMLMLTVTPVEATI